MSVNIEHIEEEFRHLLWAETFTEICRQRMEIYYASIKIESTV